jgi:hypothetical protein
MQRLALAQSLTGLRQPAWEQVKQPLHPHREYRCQGKAAVVSLPVPTPPLVFARTVLHTHEQYEEMAEVERGADGALSTARALIGRACAPAVPHAGVGNGMLIPWLTPGTVRAGPI